MLLGSPCMDWQRESLSLPSRVKIDRGFHDGENGCDAVSRQLLRGTVVGIYIGVAHFPGSIWVVLEGEACMTVEYL